MITPKFVGNTYRQIGQPTYTVISLVAEEDPTEVNTVSFIKMKTIACQPEFNLTIEQVHPKFKNLLDLLK